jgi:hypothetical protein
LDYIKKSSSHSNTTLYKLADIGGQLSSVYTPEAKEYFASYGDSTDYKNKILSDDSMYTKICNGETEVLFPYFMNVDGQEFLYYRNFGGMFTSGAIDQPDILRFIGVNSSTVAIIINNTTNIFNMSPITIDFHTMNTFNDPEYVSYIFDKYL